MNIEYYYNNIKTLLWKCLLNNNERDRDRERERKRKRDFFVLKRIYRIKQSEK